MLNIAEDNVVKWVKSDNYNLYFNKESGLTARWGCTKEDDPLYAPSPEILDLEISEVIYEDQVVDSPYHIYTKEGCSGNCPWCYKLNNRGNITKHLNLDGVRLILDKMKLPQGYLLNQVALGITSSDSHPQLFDIAQEFRHRGICCNLTANGYGFTDSLVEKYCDNFNAMAISVHSRNKEQAYDAIYKLSQKCSQVNIHFVLAEETFAAAKQIIDNVATDIRLAKLNALVLLAFKDKQKTGIYQSIHSVDKYKDLLKYAEQKNVRLGLDSCSGPTYLKAIADDAKYQQLSQVVETCCACRFSSYISCDMIYYPCSFVEKSADDGWETGLNLLDYENFDDIWNSEKVKQWRQHVICCGEKCVPCHYFNRK